jgi:hypothetical protein
MCIISSTKEALNITILNVYSDLELIFPVYYSNGTMCYMSSGQQTAIGTEMKVSFEIAFKQEDFKGALLYKLQRKYAARTDNQPNSSTASAENAEKNIYLLVLWNVEDNRHRSRACLIECTTHFSWDEDKLWALHKKHEHLFDVYYNSNTITWLIYDDTVMKMRFDVTYRPDYKLDIVISEGTREDDMERPIEIDQNRLVLALSMLIMLIYAVRLDIYPSVKLNIENKCSNVNLISLTYFTDDMLECHRPPGHNVFAGDTMKSGFIIKSYDTSYGALIYRLQKGQRLNILKLVKTHQALLNF